MDRLEEIFHKIMEEKSENKDENQNSPEMTTQQSANQEGDMNSNSVLTANQTATSCSQSGITSKTDNLEIQKIDNQDTLSKSIPVLQISTNQEGNAIKTANQDDALNSNSPEIADQDNQCTEHIEETTNQNEESNSNLKDMPNWANEECVPISTLEIIDEEDEDVCYTDCEILEKSELESKFKCPLIIAMTVLNKDSILRLEQDGRQVSTVNKCGHVTQTVQLDFEACDLAVTEDGDILLASYHDECIMKLKEDGTVSKFIKLISGKKPMALDFDQSSGDLWVACVEEGDNCGYIASLKMYFHDGTLLQYVYYHDNTLSHYPMKISISPSTGDVAISETKVDEEREVMTVTVLNQWGTEKWSYPPDESFNTEDAEFDSMSNLLVSVPCDKGLHLVGEKGTLLRIIYQCDVVPQIITTAMNGRVWMWCQDNVENGFEIRTVKYLDVE